GGGEVGGWATFLPARRDRRNPEDRAVMACLWGVPALAETAGVAAVGLFGASHEGEGKAVYIACTNPAQSLPDLTRVRAALEKAEFVVLQEAYADTETCEFADLLLPAAGWGEKSGTVTNSERRVTRVRAAIAPPAEARPDWAITADFARRLAKRLDKPEEMFAFDSEAEIFAEHVALTAGRDCDMSG